MNNTRSRWFPAIARHPRRLAIGIVGLAVVGGAFAGPVAAQAASATATAPAAAYTPFEKALWPDLQFQPNFYYCAPAATRLAITAGGHAAPSQDDLAWMLGTTTNGTNSALDTTRVLNRVLGAGVYQTREIPGNAANAAEMDRLRVDVVNAVSNGRAVVANIVGSTMDISGRGHDFAGGHYLTVVGYGEGGTTMKIADPADTEGGGSYWISTINLANWIATRGYSA
jgi:Peptidase_C39 like family